MSPIEKLFKEYEIQKINTNYMVFGIVSSINN